MKLGGKGVEAVGVGGAEGAGSKGGVHTLFVPLKEITVPTRTYKNNNHT